MPGSGHSSFTKYGMNPRSNPYLASAQTNIAGYNLNQNTNRTRGPICFVSRGKSAKSRRVIPINQMMYIENFNNNVGMMQQENYNYGPEGIPPEMEQYN